MKHKSPRPNGRGDLCCVVKEREKQEMFVIHNLFIV